VALVTVGGPRGWGARVGSAAREGVERTALG